MAVAAGLATASQQQRQQQSQRGHGSFVPRRLCAHWSRTGWCRKGDQCTFAHGLHELHPDIQATMVPTAPHSHSGVVMVPPPYGAMQNSVLNLEPSSSTLGNEVGSATYLQEHASVGERVAEFRFNADATPFGAQVGHGSLQATPPPQDMADRGRVVGAEDAKSEGLVAQAAAVNDDAARFTTPLRRKAPAPLMDVDGGESPQAPLTLDESCASSSPGQDSSVSSPSPVLQDPMIALGGAYCSQSPAAVAARRFLTRIGAASWTSPTHQGVQPLRFVVADPGGSPLVKTPIASPKMLLANFSALASPTVALSSPTQFPSVMSCRPAPPRAIKIVQNFS